jgi:DNA-binding NarL/FixJ family response regulator
LRHGSDCLRIDVLDPIERDVIAKAAAGLSDDRIAQTLGLEPAAIRSAFASALGKLGLPRARAAFTLPDPSRP